LVASKKEVEMASTRNNLPIDKAWSEFREEYERVVLPGMRSERSRDESRRSLSLLERIAKPRIVRAIDRKFLDEYVAKRRDMPGKKADELVSPETIKKELRTIRAALSQAHEWGYLPVIPSMPRITGFGKEKNFIAEEHFNAMMSHCDAATLPCGPNQLFTAGDWWRALLGMLWVAPHRISAALSLRWEDTDLEGCTVISRSRDNKQKKDQRPFFTPSVAVLLTRIRQLADPRVFPWDDHKKTLYDQFALIQTAAGIHLPCLGNHQHTDACHRYGFHDFRRAFATYNRDLPAAIVQGQMGHASYSTTMRYDQYGKEKRTYADRLHIPQALRPDVSVTCETLKTAAVSS
jgi:integrase